MLHYRLTQIQTDKHIKTYWFWKQTSCETRTLLKSSSPDNHSPSHYVLQLPLNFIQIPTTTDINPIFHIILHPFLFGMHNSLLITSIFSISHSYSANSQMYWNNLSFWSLLVTSVFSRPFSFIYLSARRRNSDNS